MSKAREAFMLLLLLRIDCTAALGPGQFIYTPTHPQMGCWEETASVSSSAPSVAVTVSVIHNQG